MTSDPIGHLVAILLNAQVRSTRLELESEKGATGGNEVPEPAVLSQVYLPPLSFARKGTAGIVEFQGWIGHELGGQGTTSAD